MTPRQILHEALNRGGDPNILAAAAYYLDARDTPGFVEHARSVCGSSVAQRFPVEESDIEQARRQV